MEQTKTLDKVSLYIEGVKCSKCIQKLESLPLRSDDIITSQYDQGSSVLKLEVNKNSESSSLQSWVTAIQALGFKATPVFTSSDIEEKQKIENRNWLLRLGVTFFISGNIMMFSAAIYTGAVNEWKSFFAYLSGILFLPILFYSATPFFKQTLQSLKDRTFSADVAITIALVWGAVLSYVNLFRGNNDFYFDSTASFIFLILLSRYALLRMQNRFHSDLHPDTLFSSNPFYDVQNSQNDKIKPLHFKDLKKDDYITIKAEQVVPTNCKLLSEFTEIDTSMYNGESLPKLFKRGEEIKSGMTNLSQDTKAQVIAPFAESELALLFNKIMQGKSEKTRAVVKAEKSTSLLLIVVSILSLLVLAYFGWQQQWDVGFQRALALFTIACPCALSFAIPLASFTALKRSLEQGLFVKSPLFFEKINEVKKIYFDKTGTLTEGVLSFSNWTPDEPSQEIQSIIYSLEIESAHPLAKSICKFLRPRLEKNNPQFKTLQIENRTETPGYGISGSINGIKYDVKALVNPTSSAAGFTLYKNDEIVTSALFTDHIKQDTKDVLAQLKKLNYYIGVLSGDHEQSVEKTTQALDIDKSHCYSGLNPDEKALKVVEEKALMVGDGHNDALALSKAYASIAVNGSAWTSLRAADSYCTTGGVNALPLAFKMSQFYNRLIKQNITLSLAYNIIAGLAAIFGFVNPLTAAVLMPINSVIVISFTAIAKPRNSI